MTSEIIIFVLAQIGTAAGVYAAIKADLRELRVRIELLDRSNDRQDLQIAELLDRRWGKR